MKRGTGNREQGTGDREQGTGNREQGTGNREQGTGNGYVLGSCSRMRVRERVVMSRAAARMSAPPVRALGPRASPRTKTPSSEPMSGSMLSRTPACEAATWVRPQFHSRVVEAVQRDRKSV